MLKASALLTGKNCKLGSLLVSETARDQCWWFGASARLKAEGWWQDTLPAFQNPAGRLSARQCGAFIKSANQKRGKAQVPIWPLEGGLMSLPFE